MPDENLQAVLIVPAFGSAKPTRRGGQSTGWRYRIQRGWRVVSVENSHSEREFSTRSDANPVMIPREVVERSRGQPESWCQAFLEMSEADGGQRWTQY